jgi:hypothetical protein
MADFFKNLPRSRLYRSAREEAALMGTVVLDMSMSLDGFIAGPNDE